MDPEILKGMQEGHGGWNAKMAEVCCSRLLYMNILVAVACK